MSDVAPTFREAVRFWWKLGWISFGGPAGQIAILHQELVERRKWVDERRFLAGLGYCMLLPGPEAQQLATYLGWSLHGVRGGWIAGALFVLPAAFLLWGLSYLYVAFGARPEIAGVLRGLEATVIALVVHAVVRLSRRVLQTAVCGAIAVGALALIGFTEIPFPAIVLAAAVIGAVLGRVAPKSLGTPPGHHGAAGVPISSTRSTLLAGAGAFVLWWLPVLLAIAILGADSTLARMGVFFSQAALVTFGGAYAVLPYVAERAVVDFGWLSESQMLTGLGLAETTPGPLIIVLEFVGFVGGWNQPGEFSPLLAATLCAAITVWATFLPSFMMVFLGAPYVEKIDRVAALRFALTAVSCAVIGVIAHLAYWFYASTLWRDGVWRPGVTGVTALVLFLLIRFELPVIRAVLLGATLGALLHSFGLS